MADDVALGVVPVRIPLHLSVGGDFVCTIESVDGTAWPGGMTAVIKIGTATWAATVVADEVRFNVDKPAVQAIIDERPETYKMFADDLHWMEGPVKIHA